MRAVHLPKLMVESGAPTRNGPPAPIRHRQLSQTHTQGEQVLSRLVAALGSTTSAAVAGEILVDSLAALEGCGAALLYRWEADRGRLVLTASAPERPGIHSEEYAPGQGVVGNTALRPGRPVIGNVRSDRQGRATFAPNRAMVGLHIAARDGTLLGVLALVAGGPGPLAAASIRTATDGARLVAQVLEHEQLTESVRAGEELLGSIAHLIPGGALKPLGDVMEAIAEQGLRAMRVQTCAIYVTERGNGPLRLAAVSPRDAEIPLAWQREAPDGSAGSSGATEVTLVVPALFGTERFGVVALADRTGRAFSAADHLRAEQLARIVALATYQRAQTPGALTRTLPEDLMWDILGPQSGDPAALLARAHGLGCDLTARRIVIVGSAPDRSTLDLRSALQALNVSTLSDVSSGRLTAIAPESALSSLTKLGLSIGVSQPCDLLARYPLAYRQARDAHDLGKKLFGGGRVIRYEELGGYRFVSALLAGVADEPEYAQISRLSDDLLKTLEAYLDSGGNTAQAANQLFLHRNTVRQRLDRISTLLDLDLTAPSRWLSLQLVIKTARLERLSVAPDAEQRST